MNSFIQRLTLSTLIISYCNLNTYAYPKVDFMAQQLDHFDLLNQKTWQQRYFYSTDHYKPGGIVIIGIHDMVRAPNIMNCEGIWYDHAMRFFGYIFSLEHRFFGDSRPVDTLTDENLSYLTASQTVEDVITFIHFIKEKFNFDAKTKWMVYGCGFDGTIATLLRIQKPGLVDGVVAISAPLSPRIDFKEYSKAAELVWERYSPECIPPITEGRKEVEALLKKPDGVATLRKTLRICGAEDAPLTEKDQNLMFNILGLRLCERSLNHNIYNMNTGKFLSFENICNMLVNDTTTSAIDKLAKLTSDIRKEKGEDCLLLYDDYVKAVKNTAWDKDGSSTFESLRQMQYAHCNQFGYFPTSELVQDIMGNHFPLDFYFSLCKDIFPSWNLESLKEIVANKKMYLKKHLPSVTRTIFVSGTDDPWFVTGYNTTNPESHTIHIKGTSHCSAFYAPHSEDNSELKAAREEIAKIVGEWVSK